MLLIVPYKADVPMYRWPIANFVIIGVCLIVFVLSLTGNIPEEAVDAMILNGWNPIGLLGHMWLHAGPLHLLGNMVFLWVFGNAICAKVGNAAYPFMYAGLGLIAAAAHVLSGGGEAVGASGAINGIVAMFLMLYPVNEVSFFWLFFFFVIRSGLHAVSSVWLILLWCVFDAWGLVTGSEAVAYTAHIAGFAGGILLAYVLIVTKGIEVGPGERTLMDVLLKRKRPEVVALRRVATAAEAGSASAPAQTKPASVEAQVMATLQEMSAEYVHFQCPCGKKLKTARSHAGRRVRCPICARMLQIPTG